MASAQERAEASQDALLELVRELDKWDEQQGRKRTVELAADVGQATQAAVASAIARPPEPPTRVAAADAPAAEAKPKAAVPPAEVLAGMKRRRQVSEEERLELRSESEAAQALQLTWAERGPPGPPGGGPANWRGQHWREGRDGGKSRFANRGGKWRAWYDGMYTAKAKGLDALAAFMKANPKEKAAAKSSGGT